MKFRLNNSGMTLMAMLVAGIISIIILYSFMSMMTLMQRSQKSTEASVDYNNLYNSIVNSLSSEQSCGSMLGAGRTTPLNLVIAGAQFTDVNPLRIGAMTIAEVSANVFGLRVTTLRLQEPILIGNRIISGGITQAQYSAQLHIEAQKLAANGTVLPGGAPRARNIPVTLYTQNIGANPRQVVACHGQWSDARACEDIGGTSGEYNGAQNPRCLLQQLVLNPNRTGQQTAFAAGSLFTIGNATNPRFTTISDTGRVRFGGVAAADDGDGEVVIKPMDVENVDFMLDARANGGARWDLASLGAGGNQGEFNIRNMANGNPTVRITSAAGAQKLIIDTNLTTIAGDLNVTGTVRALGFGPLSDARLKTKVTPLSKALELVRGLRAVYFHWKKSDDGRRKIGFLAQEVEKVVPEVVETANDELKTKSLNYTALIPVLVKAIQEQQEEIDRLKSVCIGSPSKKVEP